MRNISYRSWRSELLGVVIVTVLAGAGCGAPEMMNGGDAGVPDTPCACTVGAKRCTGAQIQVCEATTPECPSWGPAADCPSGTCMGNACPGGCVDTCPGGMVRCANETEQEVCRIGPSGCLEWVKQACPGTQYCGGNSCLPAIPCEPSCPSGYTCSRTGVCMGGAASNLILDVKTISVSGRVTLNGATPTLGANCPAQPSALTATLEFTELTKGYSTLLYARCNDSTFSFSGSVYPGTYRVRINNSMGGAYSNLPTESFSIRSPIANDSLALNASTTGLVLDVKTISVSGRVTLNGATPALGVNCPAQPAALTATLEFADPIKGYLTVLYARCNDNTFSFSGTVYPGTYQVRVNNSMGSAYSNLPTESFSIRTPIASDNLALNASTVNLVLDVKTISVGGRVTLNGATPALGVNCPAQPAALTATIEFTELSKGYLTLLYARCNDSTFSFSGTLYPGTYQVRVNNSMGSAYSNLPTESFSIRTPIASDNLALNASNGGLILDVKTISVGGRVTLNGATPALGVNCPAQPAALTATLEFTELSKGYLTVLYARCNDSTFSFSGTLYPGTYQVRVNNSMGSAYSNLPTESFSIRTPIASDNLALNASNGGLILDVKTISVGGRVTLNSATPALGVNCPAQPSALTATLEFTELSKGYLTPLYARCNDNTFSFSGTLYPGTYQVRINNSMGSAYSNLPTESFSIRSPIANDNLALNASTAGLVLDVKTISVGGRVTLNGATPTLGVNCPAQPSALTATLEFADPTKGYLTLLYARCNDSTFSFSGSVYPGTYQVRINNTMGSAYSNLPTESFFPQSHLSVLRLQIP